MEEQGVGYLFLRVSGVEDEALFIRCTDAPIDQIARQIFQFISEPFDLKTPNGYDRLDLTPARLGAIGWDAYLAAARREGGLIESVRRIAAIIPQTLVLIIDQAEEVITQNRGLESVGKRASFFAFLRAFQNTKLDARIIVAFRTEYFGRIIDAVQISYCANTEIRQFFLNELSRSALIEAILRPTLPFPIENFGIPSRVYGFRFNSWLPEKIVDDILSATYTGPALPVLQLVCLGLYEATVGIGINVIKQSEYREMGGVDGHIISHIACSIRALYSSDEEYEGDLDELRAFLGSFYSIQDDGTVVSRGRATSWITNNLKKRASRTEPGVFG